MSLYIPVGILIWIVPYSPATTKFLTSVIWWNGNPLYLLIMFAISTFYLFYIGIGFFKSAYKALKHKSANMDVLIAIGTTSAWIYGTLLILIGYEDYQDEGEFHMQVHSHAHNFETASVLITIVLIGKFIESYSKMKTVDKLSELASLKVSQANLLDESDQNKVDLNSKFKTVKVELLEKNDLVIVQPGA